MLQRIIANARLGAARRAQLELERIRPLVTTPYQYQPLLATAERELAAAKAALPKEPSAVLLAQLEQSAKAGDSFEQLVARARVLHVAFNNQRKRYEDHYFDQWWERVSAIGDGTNPDTLVATARFLADEAALGQPDLFPLSGFSSLRNGRGEEGELAAASQLLDRALQLNPNHAAALCGKANVLMLAGRYGDAFAWAKKALAVAGDDPTALWVSAVYCERRSIQAAAPRACSSRSAWTSAISARTGTYGSNTASIRSREPRRHTARHIEPGRCSTNKASVRWRN
jgi:tetratricopeptide (TPR) repeat protein